MISNTCDDLAESRTNDLVVKLSFYKDTKGNLLYEKEDFDILERLEIQHLVGLYNEAIKDITTENIKKLAASDFFMSLYGLTEKNPSAFFGTSVTELTFFQVNLLSYAKMVFNIQKNFNPPDHIRNDTDALISFAKTENQKAQKKQSSQGNTGGGLLAK